MYTVVKQTLMERFGGYFESLLCRSSMEMSTKGEDGNAPPPVQPAISTTHHEPDDNDEDFGAD
jgi:hypothetical protein